MDIIKQAKASTLTIKNIEFRCSFETFTNNSLKDSLFLSCLRINTEQRANQVSLRLSHKSCLSDDTFSPLPTLLPRFSLCSFRFDVSNQLENYLAVRFVRIWGHHRETFVFKFYILSKGVSQSMHYLFTSKLVDGKSQIIILTCEMI